jgi:hypothetical protein
MTARVGWPRVPFHEVRAYFYSQKGNTQDSIVISGQLHPTVENPEGALLDLSQVELLLDALLLPHPHLPIMRCYFPRHGFVFWDSEGTPVAHASLCFECFIYRLEAGVDGLSLDWLALAELVESLGLPLEDGTIHSIRHELWRLEQERAAE